MNIWTLAKVEDLRLLHAKGLSASAIAAELGEGFTRNAVIGKVHRLGISRKQQRCTSFPRTSFPRIIHRKKPSLKTMKNYVPDEQLADIRAIEFNSTIPVHQRKSLMQLTNFTCRFHVGDPCKDDGFFCGGKADLNGGRSYCAFHHRLTHQPPDAARRIFVPMRVVRA